MKYLDTKNVSRKIQTRNNISRRYKKKTLYSLLLKSKVCAHIVNWTFFIAVVIMDGEYIYYIREQMDDFNLTKHVFNLTKHVNI